MFGIVTAEINSIITSISILTLTSYFPLHHSETVAHSFICLRSQVAVDQEVEWLSWNGKVISWIPDSSGLQL